MKTLTGMPQRKPRWADKMLSWLRQVQQDRELTDFQARVAIVIAHQCDPYRGQLEMSQQQLADQCAATKTGVRNALTALIGRFHLNVVRLGSNDAPARYEPRIHSSEMPIGCAKVVAPKRVLKGATSVARSAGNGATPIAPGAGRRSSVMEAAMRDADMREKHRRWRRD